MLGKLLKHEIKQSGRMILAIYGAAAGVMAFMLIGMLTKTTWIGVVSSILLYFLGIAVALITVISVIRNFNDTLYGNQGYLSFTLPVKCSTLLLSKVLISFFWIILSLLFTGLCIVMISWNVKAHAETDMIWLVDLIDLAGLREMLPSGGLIVKLVILIAALILMHILTFVGYIYFSVTLANTRPLQNHPLLFGALIFFAIYGTTNAIGVKLTQSFPLSLRVVQDNIQIVFRSMDDPDAVFSYGIAGAIFTALTALALLFLTGYIMEHKVNIK